jgi:MFS family permease
MSAVDEAVAGPEQLAPLRRNREFMMLWSGAGFANLGARIGMIAYPLLVLWHTGSATVAGMVMFAALLPNLLVQLPAGALVDRWDRRRLMIFSDIGCCLAAGSVAVTVLVDRIWLPQLIAVAFVVSSLAIVHGLAERGGVRNLVDDRQLPTAISQYEIRSRSVGLLGQPIGTVLFALARWLPFFLTALAHLASLAMVLMIKKSFQAERTGPPRRLRTEIAEGLAWTWRQRMLRTVLGFIAATNILFQCLALALMVIVLQGGHSPAVFGLILAVGGVGGALGAVTGMWWRRRVDLRAIVVATMVVWAVLMPCAALSRDPITLGVIFAGMTYAGGVINVAGAVYQVQTTPDALQGRVGSVMLLIGSGATSVGALAGGVVVDTFGVTHTVLGLGAAMAALVVLALLSPVVRAPADRSLVAPLGLSSTPPARPGGSRP